MTEETYRFIYEPDYTIKKTAELNGVIQFKCNQDGRNGKIEASLFDRNFVEVKVEE
jgi:hypothetical protein